MDFRRLAAFHVEHNAAISNRSITHLAADMNAVHCLAQAAVNVELFTIPLYMTTMYSIQGMHRITEKAQPGQTGLYYGRSWPGISPTPNPQTANQQACNLYFSVFIQEMLHLQMAANICSALGNSYQSSASGPVLMARHPNFNSPLLMDKNNGWTCYGPTNTAIPHILDVTDLDDPVYSNVKVALNELNDNAINLALLIEEPSDVLSSRIKVTARGKYIATKPGGVLGGVPFASWTATSTEAELPLFGTIATMYECLAAYLNITYDVSGADQALLTALGQQNLVKGSTVSLFEVLFNASSQQRDLFNTEGQGHPLAEFPRMKTVVDAKTADQAKQQIFQLMNAITDQGEGATMKVDPTPIMPKGLLGAPVQQNYQPNYQALKEDYVQYDEAGQPLPVSASAHARFFGGVVDHYDRFQQVKGLLGSGEITTWVDWHNAGNLWQADLLQTADYASNPNKATLPSADAVAQALNNLKAGGEPNFTEMSRVAAGAIAGITTVLNQYWTLDNVDFPFPSMSGSGDRVSICWAVFGQAPDLSLGEYARLPGSQRDYLYHACQGMAFQPVPGEVANACASKEVFHTCRGSNACKGEGGCGFVQKTGGGGAGCRALAATPGSTQAGCGAPTLYSPPADNACGALGGCAVPISASQLYPDSGLMALYDLQPNQSPERVANEGVTFSRGQLVHDVAWEAYSKVLQSQGKQPGDKPQPSDLRLAFPPST
ncbi:ferritin-like domain-containing protein [Pokkaliibacter sp. MBI-7]|uniref:ferritin-like domain-containing protein n=1 Tax=Pokkaliibacter sp. MBI-7 TaxID=3040600 RepID=UPI0024472468|nr:ferritin-like domain-containing protein [Pokkaliibacter sp. MBI-7]MDH2432691.1 ferritin-like domain-containing protein [Pokkaliibacter sp. MBI-7]